MNEVAIVIGGTGVRCAYAAITATLSLVVPGFVLGCNAIAAYLRRRHQSKERAA